MTRITASQPVSMDDVRVLARGRFSDRSRGVDDPATRAAIADLVGRLVRR